MPPVMPLAAATSMASLAAILRVKLLSSAQNMQANAISSAPRSILPMPPPSPPSTPQAITMKAMPTTTRTLRCSRNTNHATATVNTVSRLSNRLAVAPAVSRSPKTNSTGATTPPAIAVAASHPTSRPAIGRPVDARPRLPNGARRARAGGRIRIPRRGAPPATVGRSSRRARAPEECSRRTAPPRPARTKRLDSYASVPIDQRRGRVRSCVPKQPGE